MNAFEYWENEHDEQLSPLPKESRMSLRDVPLDDLLKGLLEMSLEGDDLAAEITRRFAEPWTDPVLVEKVARGLFNAWANSSGAPASVRPDEPACMDGEGAVCGQCDDCHDPDEPMTEREA